MGISRQRKLAEMVPGMDDVPADTALAAGAFPFVELGAAHGLPRERLMAAAGLTEALRADPDARISTLAFVILWRELRTALPDVVIPVELARAMGPEALGIAGQVVLRADDLEHAASLAERFVRLGDTGAVLVREERADPAAPGEALVGFGISHRPEVVAMRFPIELMIGSAYRLLCHAAGAPVPLREVTFAHAAGFPVEPYEGLFGAPVRFGAPSSALWIPRAHLKTPFAGRDPVARRYLEAHAEQQLASLPADAPAPPPLLAQLREAIVLELATSGAELARVARRVAMSTRTVQRRLEELGTSYQALVDEVRAAMARALLRDPARSIVDVAFELGYADLRSFYRAFRRWTDATPAEWRARA